MVKFNLSNYYDQYKLKKSKTSQRHRKTRKHANQQLKR